MAVVVARLALKVFRYEEKETRELIQKIEQNSNLTIDYQIVKTTLHRVFILRITGSMAHVDAFVETFKEGFRNVTHIF